MMNIERTTYLSNRKGFNTRNERFARVTTVKIRKLQIDFTKLVTAVIVVKSH